MFVILFSFLLVSSIVTDGHHFGYSKKNQHLWMKDHKTCAGKLQSPIALSTSQSISLPLPALEMIGYHDFLKNPLKLENNGHSVTLTPSIDSINKTISNNPYIFGGLLSPGKDYEFQALHFHWGRKNNRGSEHLLNGVRYPMEMHLIHKNTIYENMEIALNNSDGLSVIGVFFQLQEEANPRLVPILKVLPDLQWNNSQVSVNSYLTLSSLMPSNVEVFYTYKGSLTTPPCNEAVTWIIFPTAVPISLRQLNKFRHLSSGEGSLADNYRHVQGIGRRKVYVRRIDAGIMNKTKIPNLDMTNLSWYWE
ncbi:carbonic anhydrase 2-like isoform X1 [Leptopilina heterotoma]|uniref:carbonic anhydrase 2-like isoform X1 n=1 Tax=Leptopilina heterotoma TaxID=63436 RepID=UPI001CA816FC|nr:carbonic anhydrase 2-like isoform X1 [Leptopilina heterotoma]